MKIAILGVRGFLGRNLSRQLIALGHEVTGYVLDPSSEKDAGFECKSVSELLKSPITNRSTFDVTINLAARRSTKNEPLSERQVHEFTYEIPKEYILRTTSPETLVLNASTYIQNFKGTTGRTVDSYGSAKEKITLFLEGESRSRRFSTLDLFFFTLYGLDDRPNHLVPLLMQAAKTGSQIALSPGHQLMNLLYVGDAVQNIISGMSETQLPVYRKNHVWAKDYFPVRDLVARIESIVGRQIDCKWGAREYAGHEMMESWPIPMEQLPDFAAPTTLEEGVQRIWKSIESNS